MKFLHHLVDIARLPDRQFLLCPIAGHLDPEDSLKLSQVLAFESLLELLFEPLNLAFRSRDDCNVINVDEPTGVALHGKYVRCRYHAAGSNSGSAQIVRSLVE